MVIAATYLCRTDVAEVSVPATLQAAIAARIDRLEPPAKTDFECCGRDRIRFSTDLLTDWGSIPRSMTSRGRAH